MLPCPFDLVRDTPFGSYTASATKLTGGMINYVWRLADASGATVIVKYADSSLAALPDVKFSVERMDFEVRGLSLFNELSDSLTGNQILRTISSLSQNSLVATASVRVPKLLHYDSDRHFLVLEDIGSHMGYEALCISDESPVGEADIDFVCAKVGEWLARLHAFGFDNLDALKPHFYNQPARDLISGLMYDMTARDIKAHTQFDDKQELADHIMQLKTELRKAKELYGHTLVFGDMWPGSILFDIDARVINILDFEFADIGLVYGDLGHFVAHLLPMHFLRDKSFNPNTDPCPHSVVAFLTAYKQTMLEASPDAYRSVVGNAIRHSTVFMGIEIARDVLTGNWCRCENRGPKTEEPLKCECADILLPLARKYIYNPSDSIFNILK